MKPGIILTNLAMSLLLLLALPAAASDYTLSVFGNANEDETINMQDVTYTELIILEYRDRTELSDAKYDGKINMQDVTQIELVILGKEKELTLLDQADRIVTVPRPIERVATLFPSITRVILSLDGCGRIVGASSTTTSGTYAERMIMLQAYPELLDLPNTGSHRDPNAEQIVSLKPDVIFGYGSRLEWCDPIQEKTGIPVVGIYQNPNRADGCFESYRLAGRVMGQEERAEELISAMEEQFAELTDVTSQIPEDEKPGVHLAFWSDLTKSPGSYYPVDLAGGINVVSSDYSITVSKEQVIAWDPDFILIHGPSAPHTLSIEDVLLDPDLQTVNAVKNRDVYYTKGHFIGWDPATGLTEAFYMAKLFHPDEFEDLDVEEKCNEILKEVYKADGLYTWLLENTDLHRWE